MCAWGGRGNDRRTHTRRDKPPQQPDARSRCRRRPHCRRSTPSASPGGQALSGRDGRGARAREAGGRRAAVGGGNRGGSRGASPLAKRPASRPANQATAARETQGTDGLHTLGDHVPGAMAIDREGGARKGGERVRAKRGASFFFSSPLFLAPRVAAHPPANSQASLLHTDSTLGSLVSDPPVTGWCCQLTGVGSCRRQLPAKRCRRAWCTGPRPPGRQTLPCCVLETVVRHSVQWLSLQGGGGRGAEEVP